MKKLFISVPMKGRTDEAIKHSMEEMHKIAELMFGEKLEVIDTFIVQVPLGIANEHIYMLGESIKKLSQADYFIGVACSEYFHGCVIEKLIARRYGIRMAYVDMDHCEFLKDAMEIERHVYDSCVAVNYPKGE